MRARDKKTGRVLASGGAGGCDKKEHPPSKDRSASAARAERQRNRPTVIAVRRRRDKNARESPVSTPKHRSSPRAPRIYKYITKIHYTPFDTKSKTPKSLSLTIFYPFQSVYTKGWIVERIFVYLALN